MEDHDSTDDAFRDATAATTAGFVAAMRDGNAMAAAAAYADNARLLPPYATPMTGRAEIQAFWQAGIDAGVAAVGLEPCAARGSGDLAYEIGRYELRLASEDDGSVHESGHYLIVHARQADDTWLRAVEMHGPDLP